MATALYRRYRPEAFAEMIGQAHVTEPLMTALRTGRIGHAYLFSGPRGCGKTTSARILARCLNCAEGPTDTPCGECPSCVELSREGGGSLDVVEIDAASHGGVDDARELRERAVFAPARDRYKIFIIDEAHMVTSGGFNALLKIVEEPPPHVKFIFATTEPEKVIGTIRSRTHHYPFRLIAPGTLIDYVQQLCDSESVAVEPGVLPLVVRAGGGSVRDTLSILDQLIAGSEEGGVTLDRATGLLGFTSTELLDEVIAALGAGDSAAAFAATDRVVQTGQDPRRFVEDLLERLRDLIVISATTVQGASAVFRGVPDDQLQRMFEQTGAFAPGQLSRIADTVSGALDGMTGATAPRLHLELMVARAMVTSASAGRPAAAQPASDPAPAGAQARPQSAAQPRESRPTQQPSVPPAPAQQQPQAPSAPEPPTPSAAPAPAAAPTIDVVAAMKSAREFLNSDSSGAQRPPMVPLGGHPPQQPAEAETTAEPEKSAEAETPAVDGTVGFQELHGIWPDLLDELLEGDRDAWNAVKGVQPLALDGVVLSIGIASRSDLDAFKNKGAGPLREAIEAALGIAVKYAPKQMPADQIAREPGAAPTEAAADAEPSPATGSAAVTGDPALREPAPREPEYSEPPAPAWAEPQHDENGPRGEFGDPGFDPDGDPYADPAYDDRLGSDDDPDDKAGPDNEGLGAAEPAEGERPDSQPASASASQEPEPEPEPEPAESAEPASDSAPPLNRYGEAVVREVLGARFVEERPLPQGEG